MSGLIDLDNEKIVAKTIENISTGLMTRIAEAAGGFSNKITVVGGGQVGMASAVSLLTQNVTNEIALLDVMKDKVKGEMMDLQQASCFLQSAKIEAGDDFSISANSRICVITAGVRQKEGESRLDLIQRNLEIFKQIIPQLVLFSPEAILLVVSNPVDILTYVVWKLSGLPSHRVIGSGTNLDSSRLRVLVAQHLGLAAESCHGWVIGEHGDSSVAVWSGVNVAGVRLPRYPLGKDHTLPEDEPDCFSLLHQQVVHSAYEVIRLKGYTCWAIGLSVSQLCQAILNNASTVYAVSTAVEGLHGIKHDIFLSLPCVLGESGVSHVIIQPLKERELKQLKSSAETVNEVISGLIF